MLGFHVRTGGPIYNEAEFNDFLLRTPLSNLYRRLTSSDSDLASGLIIKLFCLNPKNIILLYEQDGSVSFRYYRLGNGRLV